jgi:cytochrome P450
MVHVCLGYCIACVSINGIIATWLRHRENALLRQSIQWRLQTFRREPVQ